MKRLCCRFVLIGLAVSLLLSSVAFSLSVSQTMRLTLSTPYAAVVADIDRYGWMFHSKEGLEFDIRLQAFGSRIPKQPWDVYLDDIAPTWIGSGVVFARWGTTIRYALFGVKHYVVIPGLAIATLLYALWFRRRWKDEPQRDVNRVDAE